MIDFKFEGNKIYAYMDINKLYAMLPIKAVLESVSKEGDKVVFVFVIPEEEIDKLIKRAQKT